MSPVDRAQLRADIMALAHERCDEKCGTIRDGSVILGFAFMQVYASRAAGQAESIEDGIKQMCDAIRTNYPLIHGMAVKAMLDIQPELGQAKH